MIHLLLIAGDVGDKLDIVSLIVHAGAVPKAVLGLLAFMSAISWFVIVFMVTAPMIQSGVDVVLPQAKAQTVPDESGKLIVTVTKDKRVFTYGDVVKVMAAIKLAGGDKMGLITDPME